MNQLTIFCLILGLISWYYFNKFQDSEKEYNKLYKRFEHVYMENQKVKSRIKDLQSYKNDVSKTFKILDNELVLINDHLKKQNEAPINERQRQQQSILRPYYMRNNIPSNNVSLLTPDLLTSLFNMNTVQSGNGGTSEPRQAQVPDQVQAQVPDQVQDQNPMIPSTPPPSPVMNNADINTLDEIEHLDLNIDIQKFDRGQQGILQSFESFDGESYDRYLINDNEYSEF